MQGTARGSVQRICVHDGRPPVGGWFVGSPCGLEICLWLFLLRRDGSLCDDPHELGVVGVHSNARHEQHILFHLPMPVVVEWRRPGLPTTDDAEKEEAWELVGPRRASTCQATAFRLLRQDDNGASAEVARYGSRCEALAAAEAFEARHHKQTYWVEEG